MSDFRSQLNKAYQVKVEDKLRDAVIDAALILQGQLIQRTPVDTGRAKSNWFVDIGKPDTKQVEAGYANVSEGAVRIEGYQLSTTAFISNNLPYIKPLNQGSSQQAPAGFVEGSIQYTKRAVKELAR